MPRPKVLVTRPLPDSIVDQIGMFAEVSVHPIMENWDADDCAMALISYDGIVATLGDSLGKSAFASALDMRCRILANVGVGYNHIDVASARKRGVTVTNTPGAVTDATADVAMMLILMAARRAGEGERMVRDGNWPGWNPLQLLGTHVSGKTLGIVGMGRIGRAVAHRAHFGFGMDIVFVNRSPCAETGIPGARQLADLEALMAQSDFVSINVPGGEETRHLIDDAVLKAARPGLILVNTARGDVVDEAALIDALASGRIAAAGLDVYESEPYVPEALKAMENVVLLPHIGTASLEVRMDMCQMAVDNLRAFFEGRTPPNKVV